MANFSHVQSASNQGDPASATFASTPIEGNLLVAQASDRSGGSAANFTISGSGWTQRVARTILQGDTTYRRTFVVWTKIAGANEPTNVQVDDGTSNTKALLISEFAADASGTWTFEAAVSNDNGATADATSISSGTTSSIPAGDQLLIGCVGWKQGGQDDNFTWSWANSNLTLNATLQAGANGRGHAVGHLKETAAGTKTTTASFTAGITSNNGLAAALLVFTFSSGPSATVNQAAFRFGVDDGSESTHGWLAAQNTNINAALGDTVLLRFLLQASGDPASFAPTLRAQKNGAGGYVAVPVGANVPEQLSQPTYGAVGTGSSGTTSCTPSYPSGISASTSKLICVVTGRSSTANTVPTMPSGWTRIGGLEGGTGTWGVDTGTRRVDIFIKDVTTGSETGTVTVSLSGDTNNTLRATIHRIEVAAGAELDVELATGADTSNDTSYSATATTSVTLDSNRLVLIAVAQNIDSGTQSNKSITASGITFGTLTNRASTAVTNGNDHRHIVDTVPVSSGSGTVAPTYSYTISASGSGPTAFLVMRSRVPEVVNQLYVAPSANIASGGEATTQRLTGGTGTFLTGRRWDDENGSDSLDLGADQNTEVEWALKTQSPAANGDYWDFRVYAGANPLDSYTQQPRLTLGAPTPRSLFPRRRKPTMGVLSHF
jgi:hypothetical protein